MKAGDETRNFTTHRWLLSLVYCSLTLRCNIHTEYMSLRLLFVIGRLSFRHPESHLEGRRDIDRHGAPRRLRCPPFTFFPGKHRSAVRHPLAGPYERRLPDSWGWAIFRPLVRTNSANAV